MKNLLFASLIFSCFFLLTQCSKKECDCTTSKVEGSKKLRYSDSIFYIRDTVYTISPLENGKGTYTAFPDNLLIDQNTGKITIAVKGNDGNSQTGLWYKIKFKSASGETDSTMLLLSGLSYVDKFYRMDRNDSIIYPVYNGNPANAIPAGNYNIKQEKEFAINPMNGQINIKECMRRGYFSKDLNGSWKVSTIKYTINDKSNSSENQIDLVLYYYSTEDEVPRNVSRLMQAHRSMTLGFETAVIPNTSGPVDNNLPSDLKEQSETLQFKPRPPCIVIIGH